MRIWQIRPDYLKNAFYKFYEDNPLNITRILDVAQDLKACSFFFNFWEISFLPFFADSRLPSRSSAIYFCT